MLSSLSEILNLCLECPSEETDMSTTAHAHSTPYWEQEVGLLSKLLCHFHKIVVLWTALMLLRAFSPTVVLPDGHWGARAHSMLLAALIRALPIEIQKIIRARAPKRCEDLLYFKELLLGSKHQTVWGPIVFQWLLYLKIGGHVHNTQIYKKSLLAP